MVSGLLVHAVLLSILLSGVLYIVVQGYQEQFTNDVRLSAHQTAEHISETSLSEHTPGSLDEIIASGRGVYARVILKSGKSFSSTINRVSPDSQFQEDFFFGDHGDNVYYISMPLRYQGEDATLQVGYDETLIKDQIQHTYERGLLFVVGYILVSLLLLLALTPKFTRPLQQLRDAAQKIAAGATSERLKVSSGISEITGLADDLERMRAALVASGELIAVRETHIRAIMDNVLNGIITIHGWGHIESMNPAAERLFGYEANTLIGKPLTALLEHGIDSSYAQRATVASHESVARHRDGHTFPVEMAVSQLRRKGGVLYIAIVRDITERKQFEAGLKSLQEELERRVAKRTHELAAINLQLEHQALHDSLTELPNRLLLTDRLRHAIMTAQRKKQPLALFIADLDHFKEINDTLGHHYGDVVLQQVAIRMRGALRESDTISRLGGDEFAMLLPAINGMEEAVQAASKLAAVLEQPIQVEDQSLHVGISIGIALFPDHGTDSSTLMRHADVAMYVAKRASENYAIYNPDQDQHSVMRLAMAGELRHAIESQQLVLFYQPKVDLKRGRVTGVEALVRWQHPQHGLLLPDEFIPLAEQTGLIRPLTLFVLDEALRQMRRWHKSGRALTVSINLSAKHLQDQQLADKIASLIGKWQVPARALILELTESAIMADPLRAMNTLKKLKEMGVMMAIDDFGTGYSSLVYLKQLPVSEIKIDKSFVINMLDNSEDMVIVRSTIDLAHNMGLRVVAEGVESVAVMKKLTELGCDQAQGYCISCPASAAELTEWLNVRNDYLNDCYAPSR